MSLVSSPSWGEDYDNLFRRDGLYYKKFTNTPFTGTSEGSGQGYIKDGKKEGPWLIYGRNGGLLSKGYWIEGKPNSYFWYYWENGMLMSEGLWVNGEKQGEWISYHENGMLESKGKYKNGKENGPWIMYWIDGTISELSGIYKDGVKVSE